jgi:hypothetical protein
MKTAYVAEGPSHCFLVVENTSGERLAIEATSVTSVEQQGSQVVIHWLHGETSRSVRVNLDVDAIVKLLCSAQQNPVVDFEKLAQEAFGR